ncbi:MAG: hypothetical protein WBF51_01670, partial [Candidatus Dormiibacterota bacterium]
MGERRRILITSDLVISVSGRSSSPARAAAQYASNSSVSMILPRTTHRPATAPLRCPALSIPRTSSFSLALGPKR